MVAVVHQYGQTYYDRFTRRNGMLKLQLVHGQHRFASGLVLYGLIIF